MTVKGYVLIEVEGGRMVEVAEVMQRLEGVKKIDLVTGPYDAIAPIEVVDFSGIGSVIREIDSLPGITRTVTCLALN
jgi:DNA-binding Lrp family transcriptional regulator